MDSPYRMPLAEPVGDPQAMKLLDVLPDEARRTARAAGLEPLLVELMRAQTTGPNDTSARRFALQHELTLRLLAFDSQLSSLSFETECTRRHLADIASDLDGRESGRQLLLATGSLVVGAGTGISAGVLDLAGTQSLLPSVLAVTGGVLVAGLGVAALSRALRAGFRAALQPFAAGSHVRAVVFGDGGIYSRALLHAREQMFHQLAFAVQGVARSLELLGRALVRVLVTEPGGAAPPPSAATEAP